MSILIFIFAILEIVGGVLIFQGGPLAFAAATSAIGFGFLMLALAGILNEAERIRRLLQRREEEERRERNRRP